MSHSRFHTISTLYHHEQANRRIAQHDSILLLRVLFTLHREPESPHSYSKRIALIRQNGRRTRDRSALSPLLPGLRNVSDSRHCPHEKANAKSRCSGDRFASTVRYPSVCGICHCQDFENAHTHGYNITRGHVFTWRELFQL